MRDLDRRPGVTLCMMRCAAVRALALLAAVFAVALLSSPTFAQLRIVNYNIAQLKGNLTNLQNVLAALHEDDKPGFAVPVSIFLFQEVRSADINTLQATVNAAAPPGITYVRGTYTTSTNEDNSGGAQAIFFRSGLLTEQHHVDIATGAGRNTDRWLMRLVGYNSTLAWMYIYSSHLKAGDGSADQSERLNGVTAIRNNSDSLGMNLHIIYAGDMNFYHNNEAGYLRFFDAGNGQAIDPLGTGPWNGNINPPNNANNWKHTQSPLLTSVNGLVGGGMNSRFDLQLSSNAMHDGLGLTMIAGTYRALGNDGNHYNQAIDNGNNTYYPGQLARSNALATNLRLASDHVPLVVEYRIPAMMAGSVPANYGRVIVGTPFWITASVTNPAPVAYVFGAEVLNYTATGGGNLSGVVSDSVAPLGDVSNPSLPLNTSSAGIKSGTITLTSGNHGVQPASLVLNTTGTVVRPSNPSFSNSSVVTELALPQSYDADTGIQTFSVNVHNFGFDSLQAKLDVDGVSTLSPPFAFVGGAPTLDIGTTPATLTFSFNTDGIPGGKYTAPVTIYTSDENIPGEAAFNLALTIAVTVNGATPCPADINGDAVVNVSDLLAVINAWGPCQPPPPDCAADINGDGVVNVSDLLAVINAWGACP